MSFVLPCSDSTRSNASADLKAKEDYAGGDCTGQDINPMPGRRLCSILQLRSRAIYKEGRRIPNSLIPSSQMTTDLPQLASKSPSHQAKAAEDRRPGVFLMSNTLEVGGSERQFVALVESLSRERLDVHPACLLRIGGLAAKLGDIPEFPPGGGLVGIRSQLARWAIARSLRRDGIAVAHAFDFYTNLMLIPAARIAGVPVIGSHRQLGDLLTSAQFKAQRWAFRFCSRVVCNSRAAAVSLLSAGLPEEKLEIIPNGLTEEAFIEYPPAIPRKPGVVRVGMIARMNNTVKNHPAFLRAAAKLSKQYPIIEFVLLGDGPLRPGLEAMAAELGITEKVFFAGERHDISAMLASLDISVLISSSESLSNVILESMAAGVPVVATDVGGNPELVKDGETGLLVPPGDEEKLVEALARLVRDPILRTQYARQSKEFARSQFHIGQVSRRFEQLYLAVIKAQV
jgi:glycosyltransferase involved in cell wall biosynthesis